MTINLTRKTSLATEVARRIGWAVLPGFLFLTVGLFKSANAQPTSRIEAQNKKLIQQALERWASGSGNFFDLLTDDVQWTITGSSPYAKTYTSKQQFINQSVTPLSARLAKPIVPTVRNLYADGNVVVAIWDGATTAKASPTATRTVGP